MYTLLLPTRTLALVGLGAVGLQLLGVDIFGMAFDFFTGLVPDFSWSDLGGLV